MQTITITGYLGRDREIRTTRQRTDTAEYVNPLTESTVRREVNPPTRDYALLRVASHDRRGGKQLTTWHRVIIWNVDQPGTRSIHVLRKGDRVRITAHRETFCFTTEDGDERSVEQLIAHDVTPLSIKPRMEIR